MKKILLKILAASMLFAVLAGCSDTDKKSAETSEKAVGDESSESSENTADIPVSYEPVRLTSDKFDDLLLHGRTVSNSRGLCIDWQYSGFTVEGYLSGEVSVEFEMRESLQCFISVTTDGNEQILEIPAGSSSFVIADVEEGMHRITFRKCTEYRSCRLVISALDYRGVLRKPAPEETAMKIEFIGDSVTCGVGSSPTVAKNFSDPRDCSVLNAFSVMTARKLNADANIISIGGWGVSKGSNAKNGKIPDIYRFSSYKSGSSDWDFSRFQPDFIVITLGANDTGADRASFKKAAADFLSLVREKNPESKIIWVYGYLFTDFRSEITEAIAETGDGNISYLEVTPDFSGGWKHPSYAAQCRFADAITAEILKLSDN